MAKAPPKSAKPKLTKTVSEANLARLTLERLAALLAEAAAADPALKRRLRLELAGEIGAPDLALELDKRMTTLSESRARISWRKRPELIRELQGLRRLIADRLFDLDPVLALPRMVAWFDLHLPLSARAKDPKGELALVFDDATPDLARIASALKPDAAAPLLSEALSTRSAQWASFVGRAAPGMSRPLAARLLADLTAGRPVMTPRTALVVRKLADRAGDLDAWLTSFSDEDRRRPAVQSAIAHRLADAGRPAEARAALDAARPVPQSRGRAEPAAPDDAFYAAEIAVLEAEGRPAEAMDARWLLFERTLSPETLRDLIARLDDFEDVEATDRAVAFAASYFDLPKALGFLIGFGALREAAQAVVARQSELSGRSDDIPLWASRLAGRFDHAALLLLRARARALYAMGAGEAELDPILAEAEGLAARVEDVEPHGAFVASLSRTPAPTKRRGWLR